MIVPSIIIIIIIIIKQENDYTLCLKKTHQLGNSIGKNYRDQFWWNLAEILKSL